MKKYNARATCMSQLKIFISFIFLFCFTTILAQSRKDTLWKTWKNVARPDTVRLKAIGRLSSEFYLHQDPDSGIILTTMAFDFAFKRKLTRYMAVALTKKSAMYSQKGDYAKSLYYIQESLKYFKEIHYDLGIATCLNNMGEDYMVLQRNAEGIPCFYEALKIFEKEGDKLKEAAALSNIARCYQYAILTDSAIIVGKRCLRLCESIHEKWGMADMNEFLGDIYITQSKLEEALKYQQKALALQQEINDRRGMIASYYNFGKINLAKGNYINAERYWNQSMSLCIELKDSIGIGACFLSFGELNEAQGNIDKAIQFALKGLEIVHCKYQPMLTQDLYALLSKLYERKKNFKEALAMHKLFIRDRDSSVKLNADNVLYQEHMSYDFEKKQMLAKAKNEKNVALIKAEAERKDLQKNIWLTVTLAAFLILLLSTWFVYSHFKQKSVISRQKNNLLKQQLLVSQMNPHFIFNSLNAVQNFILKQDGYQASIYLKKFSELIRMILDFSRRDLITLEEEFIFLQNYLELQKLRFNNKLRYELKIDPSLEQESVMIPPMLGQPFIENAIEHGIFFKSGEGFLSVKVSLQKNTLLYEIEDDGIGINESIKLKNELNQKHKSLAIQITKERLETINVQNHTNFEIEVKDKAQLEEKKSGVYVKFAVPYLTL